MQFIVSLASRGQKRVVTQMSPSYPNEMLSLRHLFSSLVIAVVVAVSVNGVATAANYLGHQTHCIDAFGKISHESAVEHVHVHEHDHDGLIAQHQAPDHDHQTCMMHACSALSAEAVAFGALADIFLAKLSWPEQPLLALEHTDDLKRPPKS